MDWVRQSVTDSLKVKDWLMVWAQRSDWHSVIPMVSYSVKLREKDCCLVKHLVLHLVRRLEKVTPSLMGKDWVNYSDWHQVNYWEQKTATDWVRKDLVRSGRNYFAAEKQSGR
jgi:hypothetical protein